MKAADGHYRSPWRGWALQRLSDGKLYIHLFASRRPARDVARRHNNRRCKVRVVRVRLSEVKAKRRVVR